MSRKSSSLKAKTKPLETSNVTHIDISSSVIVVPDGFVYSDLSKVKDNIILKSSSLTSSSMSISATSQMVSSMIIEREISNGNPTVSDLTELNKREKNDCAIHVNEEERKGFAEFLHEEQGLLALMQEEEDHDLSSQTKSTSIPKTQKGKKNNLEMDSNEYITRSPDGIAHNNNREISMKCCYTGCKALARSREFPFCKKHCVEITNMVASGRIEGVKAVDIFEEYEDSYLGIALKRKLESNDNDSEEINNNEDIDKDGEIKQVIRGGKKRKLCEMENCPKLARAYGLPYCIAHGGGKRCQYPECTKSAHESGSQYCQKHRTLIKKKGGYKNAIPSKIKEKEASPNQSEQEEQYDTTADFDEQKVQIDKDKSDHIIQKSSKKRGRTKRYCKMKNCTKFARAYGLPYCIAHGGGKRCQYPDCTKSAPECGPQLCCKHKKILSVNEVESTNQSKIEEKDNSSDSSERDNNDNNGDDDDGNSNYEEKETEFNNREEYQIIQKSSKKGGRTKRYCKMKNCTKFARSCGLPYCKAHGGGKRCQYPDCTKAAFDSGPHFCVRHGGGRRCKFPNCTKRCLPSSLLCRTHREIR